MNKAQATQIASSRPIRKIKLPENQNGEQQTISEYYGRDIFEFKNSDAIPNHIRDEIIEVYRITKQLNKDHANIIAQAATKWALSKGATHFCHWFQPLTGATAEKHDSFLEFDNELPIEKLSASKLMMGEPDASSFPHGGSRTTFEARGYTTWDLTSPMFILEGPNGKTLCIPTAFVTYNGDTLDVKTPLLRSINTLENTVTEFLELCGKEVHNITITCGAEQEYFLIDKAFYYLRPDLMVSGRTLIGKNSSKDQQLSDHYFGTIPMRVLSFMQELDFELHKLGIPSKTRHNEVAPGQFEIAPQFTHANLAADQNQLIMIKLKEVAEKHDFVALLHEKPFKNINGSGKHLNWSMSANGWENLMDPGETPETNYQFLTLVMAITYAVYKHSGVLRLSSAGISNDFRLGGHEAPPSIISVFLGDVLTSIYENLVTNRESNKTNQSPKVVLDLGAKQLSQLIRDSIDRNRTSPFAFIGNRFEFRAVGSSKSIGIPLAIINAVVTDVLMDINIELKKRIDNNESITNALKDIIADLYQKSKPVVYNGDGYNKAWINEAEKRGLPNYKNTIDALEVLKDKDQTDPLIRVGIYRQSEIESRYNIFHEHYYEQSIIDLTTMLKLVRQYVIPYAIEYKEILLRIVSKEATLKIKSETEKQILNNVTDKLDKLYNSAMKLETMIQELPENIIDANKFIVKEIHPITKIIRENADALEFVIPESIWQLPRYFDMLFIK